MPIVKNIELMGKSTKSWEDATQQVVQEASNTVKNIKSLWIKEMKADVNGGKVSSYNVAAKISFEVDGKKM